jgi:hypothetical protein
VMRVARSVSAGIGQTWRGLAEAGRRLASAAMAAGQAIGHLLQSLWRPFSRVIRQAQQRARTIKKWLVTLRSAAKRRLQAQAASLGKALSTQWQRSRASGHRLRQGMRRQMRSIRLGIHQWFGIVRGQPTKTTRTPLSKDTVGIPERHDDPVRKVGAPKHHMTTTEPD